MIAGRKFRFGAFELDESLLELRCSGAVVPLYPTPLRLLTHLVNHRDRVLSKQELLQAVWNGVAVTDAALSTALKEVRQALGDDGTRQRWIQTQRGRGYRFIGAAELSSEAEELGNPELRPSERRFARTGLYEAPRSPSMCFVGRRRELQMLESLLARGDSGCAQVAVEGLAGIGKTELALQLAFQFAREEQFPAGIFWLNAETPDLRPSWGVTIADQCGIPSGSIAERCAELLRRLQALREPLLVVLDNVRSWAPGARPQPLPTGPQVRLLVTTRTRNLGGGQFKHVEVGVLRPPYDRDLIVSLAGRDVNPGFVELLAELRGHALGLELAGAFLGTYHGETAESYLEGLRRSPDTVENEARGRVGYERTVTQAFRAVWDRLSESVRAAWRLAALFAPESATPELTAAVGLLPRDLRALEELHLVQFTADGRWSMHRLTHRFGQRTGTAEQIAAARKAFVLGCTARALGIQRGAGFAAYAADRPHLDAALLLAPDVVDPESELQLLLAVGPGLMTRIGYTPEAGRQLYARALSVAEATGQHEQVFLALDGLWMNCCLQGGWRWAADLIGKIEALADNHDSNLYRLASCLAWGQNSFYTGKPEEARAWLEKGLTLARASSAEIPLGMVFHPHASLLAYAGFVHCFTGSPQQGLRLCREAAELAVQGADPGTAALAFTMLAGMHCFRGELDEAERHASRVIEIGTAQELALYRHFGSIQRAWAQIARDPHGPHAALETMRASLTELIQLNFAATRAHLTGLTADACARLGRFAEGRGLIGEALEAVERTGERWFEAELWRIRSTLVESQAEAIACLERALEIAAEQRASWWELRAATDLLNRSDTPQAADRAKQRLARICAGFADDGGVPDLQRARAALQSSGERGDG